MLPDLGVAGLRLLLPTNLAFEHIDDPTEDALDRAVQRLHRAGAMIDRKPLRVFDDIAAADGKGGFASVEAYVWHWHLLKTRAAEYDPRVASRILMGADMWPPIISGCRKPARKSSARLRPQW